MSDTPLDAMDAPGLVDRLLAGQEHVGAVVRAADASLARAVDVFAAAFLGGGRIVLLGAGTSGRLAALEAAELPGTFGIAPDRILVQVAGRSCGTAVDEATAGDAAEDDEDLGRRDVEALGLGAVDVVVAVTASGTTPYTLAAARAARSAGAAVIAVVNAADTPLAACADVAVELPTGPEVLVGSTRLAAGTAQKLALDTLTTAALIRAGRVHDRFMVDVVPANAKLVRRVVDLVAESCGVDARTAEAALARCGNKPRVTIVHLLTGLPPDAAARQAAAYRTVREAAASVR